jgi:peptidoglycan/xylan/chitin deacetylase (PgdA/CDA1 family)/tetratricopeptide (TPR) repeat protein
MSKQNAILSAAAGLVFLVLVFWAVQTRKAPDNRPVPAPATPSPSQAQAPPDSFQQRIDDIVARYRKTIVLLEDDQSLPEADREQASLIGRVIFQENHQALAGLSDELTSEIQNAGDFSQPLAHVSRFLDLIETQADLHDADKLSFREVFSDIAESLSGIRSAASAKTELQNRVDTDRQALMEIQSLYEKELDKIFGRFETRGMVVRREAWDRYVAYLHTKYKREDIVKAYEPTVGRIKLSAKQGHQDNDLETYGSKLPPKTFLLTFDDGPHPRYTDRILEILKKYQIKSVFFELGTNLGTVKQNRIEPTRASSAARHLVEAGFTIGSHGFSHNVLPKMSDSDIGVEIDETNRLLQTVANVRTPLFRPPYGDRDTKVLAAIEAHKMRSILWNVDSKDWADPVAKSIANRVIAEARRDDHGIILLHDIHERTIDALPAIIETLRTDGYRFLSWDGQGFVDDSPQVVPVGAPVPDAPPPLYADSWAVVIGVDNYLKWPKLHYAVNDANGIKDILLNKFGFKQDHVVTLLNEEATREKILSVLGDRFANPKTVHRDDRVFVFFAGHGATRRLPSGRDLGYIIPFDADAENFQGQSISMTNFQDISESIPAKHVFFIMDSCYSGLAITRGQGGSNYLREMSHRTARQMLTAGGANEEVADNGPNGHSVFTWTLLQGLEGRADLNSDGFITAAELAAYVGPGVSALSHQTPAFGNLPGSEGGEFIFELHPENEFLSQLSTQLDQEAIQLNTELDRIRKDIAAKTARNEQLRQQIAAAKSEQEKAVVPVIASPKVKDTAFAHLNRGHSLYMEKRYPEALDQFLTAAKMDPRNAEAANNAGFLYYKLHKVDDSIQWTKKAIQIDPARHVAYQNLGDLYFELNRPEDARPYYEKFLQLVPNDPYANTVRLRLGK